MTGSQRGWKESTSLNINTRKSVQKVEVGPGCLGGVQRHCPGMQGKAKAQLDLKLVQNVKAEKFFYRCLISKMKISKNVASCWMKWWNQNMKKTKKYHLCLSLYWAGVSSGISRSLCWLVWVWRREVLPIVKENRTMSHLSTLDIKKSVGPVGMLGELASIVKPGFTTLESPW